MNWQYILYAILLTVAVAVSVALALLAWRHHQVSGATIFAAIEGVSDGMIMLDSHHWIVNVNPAAQQIMGIPAAQAIGRPIAEVLSVWSDLPGCPFGETDVQAEIALGSGAMQRNYELRMLPLTDRRGQRIGHLVILHDITQRKHAEVELRAQKQLFENLVAVARATSERSTLEATLHDALDVAVTLTGAGQGDLFLVNKAGMVSYNAMAGGQVTEQCQNDIDHVMHEGLAGWVAKHRQVALVTDTTQDDRWLTFPGRPSKIRSALSVPILSGPALVGILTLMHTQPGHFAAEHLQLMQAAADQMALAVRNAQIFDAQRRMAEREIMLYQVLRAVSGQLDLDAVARTAVGAIAQFAGWSHVAVILPDEDHRQWVIRAASGILAEAIGWTFPLDQGVIGRAFITAQTQSVPDVSLDPGYVAGHPSIRSELVVPLRREKRILGALDLESDRLAAFDSEDVLLAESLAEAVALALDNARLYVQVRRHAADLSAMYAITRTTSRSLALEEVLAQALSSALVSFGFDAGLIGLIDPDDRGDKESAFLRLVSHRGLPAAYLEHLQRDGLEGTLSAYTYGRRESLILGDFEQETPEAIREMVVGLAVLGWRGYVGIPLVHQEQSLGVISLFTRQPRAFSPYDWALLTSIGNQVATAVANARLFQSTLYERSRLQALIKSSRDGVALVGVGGRILVVNAPALQMSHLPGMPEDWLGRSIGDVLRVSHIYAPALSHTILSQARRLRKEDRAPGEGEFEIMSRFIHWLNLPVSAGATPLGRLLVLRDVTDERTVERLREDMTRTMVHDLRAPLTTIFSAMEFLDTESALTFSAEQQLVLEVAFTSVQKMLGLVNSILDVSRLESGQMPLKRSRFHLADVVAEVVRSQEPLANDKRMLLESDISPALPSAWADAELIGRVLQNLVGNAIKFAPSGGVIRVSARTEESAAQSSLLVSVSDNGPGIPTEIRSRLFQKFVTGRQGGRGSGLGLAFCKLAVEAHDQRIWVESAPGRGTTFTFSLATSSPLTLPQG